jgi:hypothetical protein
MSQLTTLKTTNGKSIVTIDKGELVSYVVNSEELIHQKGTPGWRNSDTEMFPIIGPTEALNFSVSTPKGTYNQDQHGLLRELEYSVKNITENTCVFEKKYTAYTAVENSKYPEKSTVRLLSWPYNFTFKKSYNLSNTSLKITFEIIAENGMPFMLGYHPAFKLDGSKTEIIKTSTEAISIQKIMDQGSVALPVLNTSEIVLKKEKGANISLKTTGFNHFMLWTEVPTMLCIEPITAYPYTKGKLLTPDLFNSATEKNIFEVEISSF